MSIEGFNDKKAKIEGLFAFRALLKKDQVHVGELVSEGFFMEVEWDKLRKMWLSNDRAKISADAEGIAEMNVILNPELDVQFNLNDSFKLAILIIN